MLARLVLNSLNDPPTSASQSAGITSKSHSLLPAVSVSGQAEADLTGQSFLRSGREDSWLFGDQLSLRPPVKYPKPDCGFVI